MTSFSDDLMFRGNCPSKRLKFLAPTVTERADASSDSDGYIGLEHVESWTGKLLESSQGAKEQDEEADGKGTTGVFHEGDVLFGKLRPYLGKAFLADRNGVCSTEFLVLKPGAELEARYLLYLLLSPQFVTIVDSSTFGSKMPRANWEFIGSIKLPVPARDLQLRIAEFLDHETKRIDELIRGKVQMLALLDEKRIALVTQSVTRGLDSTVKLKPSGLDWLGKIPAHWRVERLKFHLLGRIEQGWSPQCDNREADDGEWGVLKVGCVNGDYFDPTENKALPKEIEPEARYEIQHGDILLSRGNTPELVGRASLVPKVRSKLQLCDLLYRCRVDSDVVTPEFVVHQLRSLPGRFQLEQEAIGTSGSMKKIGQETIQNFVVVLPSIEEQGQIVDMIALKVARIDSVRQATQHSITLLRERRSALITSGVTGQLAM